MFDRCAIHCAAEDDGGGSGGGDIAPPAVGAGRLFTQLEVNQIAATARREGKGERAPVAAPAPAADAAPASFDYVALANAIRTAMAPPAPTEPAKPATAPSAPSGPVSPVTSNGLVDMFALTSQQIETLGAIGVRGLFEQALSVHRQQAGLPTRPVVPGSKR